MVHIALFGVVNFWSIVIHDGKILTNNSMINGAACHAIHHTCFVFNYGLFLTVFDRLGGTYREPESWMFEKGRRMSEQHCTEESKFVDEFVKKIEGTDERVYGSAQVENKKRE